MKNIRIGFLGAGEVAERHAEAIQKCEGAELTGLWNRNRTRAEEKSDRFGCRLFATPEELVADPAVDAVFVLTDLETHYQYAKLALEAGKHVLVEKPVAVNAAQIAELRDLAAERGQWCMPGHNYIYETSLIRTRDLLRTGKLGRLVSVHILYNIAHTEAIAARYPGVIKQIMTHHAYMLLYLAEPPVLLSALKSSLHYKDITQEDIAMVNLKLKNGALVHFGASFAADDHSGDPWTMMVKVIGTAGATRYSYRDWVEYSPGEAHSQTFSAYPQSIIGEVDYFVNHCLRRGLPPLSTMDDALAAHEIVAAIERSADTGETIAL